MTSQWSNLRALLSLMLLSTNLIVPSMTSQWPAAVGKQCARVTITAAAMCEIVYCNPTNKFQRHLNGNTAIYKQENEMWNVIFNMVAILSRRQYVCHYSGVIMSAMASQITGVSVVYLTVSSGAEQRKHQSSALLNLCARNCFHLMRSSCSSKLFFLLVILFLYENEF